MPELATDWLSIESATRNLRAEARHEPLIQDSIERAVAFAAKSTGRTLLGEGSEAVSKEVELVIVLLTTHFFEGQQTLPETLKTVLATLRVQFPGGGG